MVPNKLLVIALYKLTAGRFDRYLQMFNKAIKGLEPSAVDALKKQVKYAMNKLKREDRIIWYLKKYRGRFLGPDHPDAIETRKVASKFSDLLHFISNAETNSYQSVLNYQFKPDAKVDQVLEDLKGLEDLEVAKREEDSRLIDHNEYEEGDIKPIIEFDDGWAWWEIASESCELEGDAMRHCGNTATPKEGDKVLSLREPIQEGDKTYYKPHATFIVNNGFLGEMKGYGNQKPKASLHPYIKKLLLSDYVDMIMGGGYEPKQNFAFKDLKIEDQKEVLAVKPGLEDVESYYKTKGLTDGIKKYIEPYFEGYSDFEFKKIDNIDYIVMLKYKDINEYAKDKDDEFEQALTNLEDSHDAIYIDSWHDEDRKEIVDALEKVDPDLYNAMQAKGAPEYDDEDDWYNEFESEINSSLWDAATADYETGLSKAVHRYIKHAEFDPEGYGLRFNFADERYYHDTPLEIVISVPDFLVANSTHNIEQDAPEFFFGDSYNQHKFKHPRWDGIGSGMDYNEAYKVGAERLVEIMAEEYPDIIDDFKKQSGDATQQPTAANLNRRA